jgi:pilus assembly protein CpaB
MLRIVLLVLSLAAGTGAAWLSLATRGAPASQVAVPIAATAPVPSGTLAVQEILVAAVDLNPGQLLAGESMRWQSWPEAALHASHVTRRQEPDAMAALVGKFVHLQIAAGEPIRRSAFVVAKPGSLSATLNPGHRAVAVRITAENTAGGFILPSDRVDVINTVAQEAHKDSARRHISRTILRNVLVLAIDQSADDRPPTGSTKDEKAKSKPVVLGKTATLEVTPPQAEALAAGEAMGLLSLALRSPLERDEPVVAHPAPVAPSAPIQVMRGAKTEVVGAGQ